MLFNSVEFLFIFFPLSYGAFLLAGRLGGDRFAVPVLLAASLAFYGYWRIQDIPLLLVSISVNYVVGRALSGAIDGGRLDRARGVLFAGIVFNLALIAWFKYLNFVVHAVTTALGLPSMSVGIELPLGISFFTFTQIAFLVDVWRRKTRSDRPDRYALFVTFYPHLIAGPILHQSEMAPQFKGPSFGRPGMTFVACGLTIFVLGLAKKVLLADPIGSYATPVFAAAEMGTSLTIWEAWSGALAYTLQIYFDFSGYSDMAVGLGLILGVRLPLNFNSPYKATSIVDFWRRWHMTLSAFLRDYLYIPLGGNRGGTARHFSNILVTMLLGGLWHGASWTFVLWGGLHGVAICVNHAWRDRIGRIEAVPAWFGRLGSQLLTFIVVVVLWVPFRAESFTGMTRMLRAMAGLDGIALPGSLARVFGLEAAPMFGNGLLSKGNFWPVTMTGLVNDETIAGVVTMVMLIGVAMLLKNTQEIIGYRYAGESPGAVRTSIASPTAVAWSRPVLVGSGLALCFWLAVFSVGRPSQFLYFNF